MFNSKQNNAYELNSQDLAKQKAIPEMSKEKQGLECQHGTYEVKLKVVSKFGFQLVTDADAHKI